MLVATIPPKVAVFTVTADGLETETVRAVAVKVRYTRNGGDGVDDPVGQAQAGRPGCPVLFFREPEDRPACEYEYTLIYAGGKSYKSEWKPKDGGIIVPVDPGTGGRRPSPGPVSSVCARNKSEVQRTESLSGPPLGFRGGSYPQELTLRSGYLDHLAGEAGAGRARVRGPWTAGPRSPRGP